MNFIYLACDSEPAAGRPVRVNELEKSSHCDVVDQALQKRKTLDHELKNAIESAPWLYKLVAQ